MRGIFRSAASRSRTFSAADGSVPLKALSQLVVASEDLPVQVALIVVPDAPAFREHGADTQRKGIPRGLKIPRCGLTSGKR